MHELNLIIFIQDYYLYIKNNTLICLNGEFYGIWCSEELKFAKSKGYEITVIKGYQFNKVNNIFNDYINELFH